MENMCGLDVKELRGTFFGFIAVQVMSQLLWAFSCTKTLRKTKPFGSDSVPSLRVSTEGWRGGGGGFRWLVGRTFEGGPLPWTNPVPFWLVM